MPILFHRAENVAGGGTTDGITIADNAAAHNCIYRGKNLGSEFTEEMSENIKNGTFKDMYIGDYLEIDGVKYRFMDFDYMYGVGDTPLETHHVVVVPDDIIDTHKMGISQTTLLAYGNSALRCEVLYGDYGSDKFYQGTIAEKISNIFKDHLLKYRIKLVNNYKGDNNSIGWSDGYSDLMNEEMIYGTRIWSTDGYDSGCQTSQLSAFRLNHLLIQSSSKTSFWLRSIKTQCEEYCAVDASGCASCVKIKESSSTQSANSDIAVYAPPISASVDEVKLGVRPFFLLA